MSSSIRSARALVVAVLVVSVSGSVLAQTDRAAQAEAEALFNQAMGLIDAGKYEAACPKLEASQQRDPAVGTLLYLADCYEQTGRTASAWATFREASYLAERLGRADRKKTADEEAERVKASLSMLTITVPDRARGLEIRRDGRVVGEELWGTPMPVDPGTVRIVATAPGKRAWEGTVVVPKGPSSSTIPIPSLQDAAEPEPAAEPPAPVPAAPAEAPVPVEKTPTPAGEKPSSSHAQATVGWIAGGAGVAGLGVGGVLLALAKSKDSDADDRCYEEGGKLFCTPEGVDLGNDARDIAGTGRIALGVGGALLATGVVLLLTAPSASEEAEGAHVFVAGGVGPRAAGVQLGGRW